MSVERFRGAVEWALMVALVFGAGAIARAQNQDEEQPQGKVIKIGKPDQGDAQAQNEDRGRPLPVAPKHWIGLLFGDIGPDHPLRAQLDIPEGEGLLVEQVMPKSPAEKAGLKRHDILLNANESPLRDKRELVELVRTAGEKSQQIAVELLRKGQRQTVYVTPEERPADAFPPQEPGAEFGPGGPGGFNPEDLLRQFGAEGAQGFQFRQFGPGMVLGAPGGVRNIPDGVSISISKEGNKPPHVTVKRGDQSWEVVGDDPESLKQLPDDLRPFVEQMLRGGSAVGMRPGQPPMPPELGDGRMRDRMERMEQELDRLRRRILRSDGEPENPPPPPPAPKEPPADR